MEKMKLNKEIILRLIILSWGLLFVSGISGCSDIKNENERLKQEIANLTAENEKLRKELSTLRDENSKMHIHLAQLNLQIASLQNEIQLLQKDIDKFRSQLKGEEKKNKKS